jgi:hypothetical protein
MLGLPFLAKILKASATQEKFELLKPHILPAFLDAPYFLTRALGAEPDTPPLAPWHGQRRRPRVSFDGDVETGPNAAWVHSKRTEDREGQGRWFESRGERWREWGYCLWDEERLKGWGFEEWNWRNGERRERGSWVCKEVTRKSGRVLPWWVWVLEDK